MAELLPGYKGAIGFKTEFMDRINIVDVPNKDQRRKYESIKSIARTIYERGWAPANAGNISIKNSYESPTFTITASGANFSDLKTEDIVDVISLRMYVGDAEVGLGYTGGPGIDLVTCIGIVSNTKDPGLLQKLIDNYSDHNHIYFREIINKKLCKAYDIFEKSKNKYRNLDLLKEGFFAWKDALHEINMDAEKTVMYLKENGLLKCRAHVVGLKEPSSESFLHGLVYHNSWNRGENDVHAIVHCHAKKMTDYPNKSFPLTRSERSYGSLELAIDAAEALGEKNHIVILKKHGVVTTTNDWRSYILSGMWRYPDYKKIFGNCLDVLDIADSISGN